MPFAINTKLNASMACLITTSQIEKLSIPLIKEHWCRKGMCWPNTGVSSVLTYIVEYRAIEMLNQIYLPAMITTL